MEVSASTAFPRTYRTLWISDLHLGMKGCQANQILEFLRATESEKLYLVGDIIDGWALRRSWYWPQAHNDVIQKLLRKARKGTEVIYIPGNHDGFARQFESLAFGEICVQQESTHTTADGCRLLVLHGDEFDGIVRFTPWLSKIGAVLYEVLLHMNALVARFRERTGRPYWSLAGFLKEHTKKAVQYIAEFESAVTEMAKYRGVDGIICGHIHKPEIRTIHDRLYANCGDWVENCTALAEHFDGTLEIIRWPGHTPNIQLMTISGDGHSSSLPQLQKLEENA